MPDKGDDLMLERIKNYMLYADTDRESYISVREEIEKSNRIISLVFSFVAFILVSVMLALSFFQEGFAKSQPVYIIGVLCSILLFVTAMLSKKFPILTYIGVYMALSVFLLYGIAIGTLTRPDQQTVTFMVMLIFLPLIFIDKPVRMVVCLAFYIVLFIIAAKFTKFGSVLSVDVTDAIIFGLLAMVSATIVIRAKIKGYVLENRLHIMSETDQLTGLNNRNCYEWRLEGYPAMCRKTLACVYIDVNGLHQLNNTQGHMAGDIMLQYIADMKKEMDISKDAAESLRKYLEKRASTGLAGMNMLHFCLTLIRVLLRES